MKFFVEYDLFPGDTGGDPPLTFRHTVTARSIGDALLVVHRVLSPCANFTRITIAEFDGDLDE